MYGHGESRAGALAGPTFAWFDDLLLAHFRQLYLTKSCETGLDKQLPAIEFEHLKDSNLMTNRCNDQPNRQFTQVSLSLLPIKGLNNMSSLRHVNDQQNKTSGCAV